MGGNFTKCLSIFDLFGNSMGFTLDTKYRTGSTCSAISSIFVMIIFVYYLIFTLLNLAQGKEYTTTYQIENNTTNSINFKNYPDFLIILCINDRDNSTIEDTYTRDSLTTEIFFQEDYKFPTLYRVSKKIESSKCTKANLELNGIHPLRTRKFLACDCITNADFKDYTIRNFMAEDYFSYITIKTKVKDEIYQDNTKYNALISYLNNKTPEMNTFILETTFNVAKTLPKVDTLNMVSQNFIKDTFVKTKMFLTAIEYSENSNVLTECNYYLLKF